MPTAATSALRVQAGFAQFRHHIGIKQLHARQANGSMGRRWAWLRGGTVNSARASSDSSKAFSLGRPAACKRRDSLTGTNTAVSVPRRVPICGSSARHAGLAAPSDVFADGDIFGTVVSWAVETAGESSQRYFGLLSSVSFSLPKIRTAKTDRCKRTSPFCG